MKFIFNVKLLFLLSVTTTICAQKSVLTQHNDINRTGWYNTETVVNKKDAYGACGGFYNDFSGNMGIVGTPAIDSTTNTMYVVARSVDTTNALWNFNQYLHAIDITTGAEKSNSPVLIAGAVTGS